MRKPKYNHDLKDVTQALDIDKDLIEDMFTFFLSETHNDDTTSQAIEKTIKFFKDKTSPCDLMMFGHLIFAEMTKNTGGAVVKVVKTKDNIGSC